MLVSIILVTYNASKFIEAAINSVLNQTYKNIELIIIDDGSSDNTKDIVLKFVNEKVKYFYKVHTGNVGNLRNYALDIAVGEYVAFIDSDDIWVEKKIEVQLQKIEEYDIVCSNATIINESQGVVNKNYFKEINNDFIIKLSDLVYKNFIITSSVLLKKKILLEKYKFESILGFRGEDYKLWLELSEDYKIIFINKDLVLYRIHEDNLSFKSIDERIELLKNTISIRKKYWDNYNKKVRTNAILGCIPIYNEILYIYFNRKDYINSKVYCNYLLKLRKYYNFKKYAKYLFLRLRIFYNILKSNKRK